MKYVLVLLVVISAKTIAQSSELYESRMIVAGFDSLPFRVMYPKNYNPDKQYPLIVFLHGSGERGNDNEKQLTHGASFFASDSIREKFPAIVLFPQCDIDMSWHNGSYETHGLHRKYQFPKKERHNRFLRFVELMIEEYTWSSKVDRDRLYVGGLSMGAMGTYELVRRNPDWFAAAFPICGAANPEIADYLQFTNWWIFHGRNDDVVPMEWSEQMYGAIKQYNANVKLTIYDGVKHDSWNNVFEEPGFMDWLFSNEKEN